MKGRVRALGDLSLKCESRQLKQLGSTVQPSSNKRYKQDYAKNSFTIVRIIRLSLWDSDTAWIQHLIWAVNSRVCWGVHILNNNWDKTRHDTIKMILNVFFTFFFTLYRNLMWILLLFSFRSIIGMNNSTGSSSYKFFWAVEKLLEKTVYVYTDVRQSDFRAG